jgi:hypothetical protein
MDLLHFLRLKISFLIKTLACRVLLVICGARVVPWVNHLRGFLANFTGLVVS